MRNAVPVEDLLFLLCSNTVVLIQVIKKGALWLLERGVGAGLEISKIGEDALFEFLRVPHRATERLKPEREASDDVRARNVEEIVPETGQSLCCGLRVCTRSPTIGHKRCSRQWEGGTA